MKTKTNHNSIKLITTGFIAFMALVITGAGYYITRTSQTTATEAASSLPVNPIGDETADSWNNRCRQETAYRCFAFTGMRTGSAFEDPEGCRMPDGRWVSTPCYFQFDNFDFDYLQQNGCPNMTQGWHEAERQFSMWFSPRAQDRLRQVYGETMTCESDAQKNSRIGYGVSCYGQRQCPDWMSVIRQELDTYCDALLSSCPEIPQL